MIIAGLGLLFGTLAWHVNTRVDEVRHRWRSRVRLITRRTRAEVVTGGPNEIIPLATDHRDARPRGVDDPLSVGDTEHDMHTGGVSRDPRRGARPDTSPRRIATLRASIIVNVAFSAGLGLVVTPLLTTAFGSLTVELYSHGSAVAKGLQQLAGAGDTALSVP